MKTHATMPEAEKLEGVGKKGGEVIKKGVAKTGTEKH